LLEVWRKDNFEEETLKAGCRINGAPLIQKEHEPGLLSMLFQPERRGF
jgi:hypothetical protein